MAMGRQESQQEHMWIAAQALPRSPGHVFYEKLNAVLEVGGFDRFVEELCARHYAEDVGRPSIPPGVYFRMLFVGYFEGLDSQRAIAWRCADSLSLRTFLRIDLSKGTPDHSSMTNTRKRLPEAVFWQVFAFVLKVAVEPPNLAAPYLTPAAAPDSAPGTIPSPFARARSLSSCSGAPSESRSSAVGPENSIIVKSQTES